ncbi:MAG: hypothetical protein JSS87_13410 [Acidobacteria bacterium]|nr:hypothetical protein [Acidobacteriota bacterium]
MGVASFFWNSTRGSRLTPWRSPYLRWRMETYTGKPADQICFKDFVELAWRERGQMRRFLHWVRTMERYAQTRHRD